MQKFGSIFDKILNAFMAFCVVAMSLSVFSNVVSRYFLDSSIVWANELSRFFFVWLVFLGAIGALKDNEHMAVDILVKRLPKLARKTALIVIYLIMLVLLYFIFDGSITITQLSINSPAPATGIPFAFINGMGLILSVGMFIIILSRLVGVLFKGQDPDQYLLAKSEVDELIGEERK